MTARIQTGLENFLGMGVPALTSTSSSVTQRGKCLPTFSLQQPVGMGRVFKVLNANHPTISLPLVACSEFATCT